MADIKVSAMPVKLSPTVTFTYGIDNAGGYGKTPVNVASGMAILDAAGNFVPIADLTQNLGSAAFRWSALVLKPTGYVAFDDGAGNEDKIGYTHASGPIFTDVTRGFSQQNNVQAYSANRTVTWPDASGTVTLLGNASTGTGSVVLSISPTFTGVPLAPTASPGTNTTQLATTAFVTAAVAVGGAVTSVFGRTGAVVATSGDYTVAQVTGAAPLASPALTGVPTAPTATNGTSTTQLATTAFVLNELAAASPVLSVFGRTGVVVATSGDYSVGQVTGAAPLASPTFTGTPAAPTAAIGTSTTQLATTAFVTAQAAPASVGVNNQSGTTYTTVLADANTIIRSTGSSAFTGTIPPNSSVAYPIGTPIYFDQDGTGQITVAAGAGVTIHSASSLTTRVQYSFLGVIKVLTDTWLLYGDMT